MKNSLEYQDWDGKPLANVRFFNKALNGLFANRSGIQWQS